MRVCIRNFKFRQQCLKKHKQGVLVGFAAVSNTLPVVVLPAYAAGVLWTLLYDTIYGHQDKLDDAIIGRLFNFELNFKLCV